MQISAIIKRSYPRLILTMFFLGTNTAILHSQNSEVRWSAFDMGYGATVSETYALKSAMGQSFAGTASGNGLSIESGLLAYPLLRGTVLGVTDHQPVPVVFALEQNYPNPFNPTTIIEYAIPQRVHVSLIVYDVLGRLVEALIDGDQNAGIHKVKLNAESYPSGVYFYRLHAGTFVQTRKLMMVK